MPEVDLSPARRAVEDLMSDACRIVRDAEGIDDEVLDEDTGVLVPVDPDKRLVYRGKCKVRHRSSSITREGGAVTEVKTYQAAIPADSALPQVGDELEVTASMRDPGLVGKRFTVREVDFTTMLVQRRMTVEEVQGANTERV